METQSVTLDLSHGLIWPHDLPPAPPPPTSKFLPRHEAPLAQDVDAAQPDAWLRLRDAEIGRLEGLRTQMAHRRLHEYYSHLVHSDIDWEARGPGSICRVKGLSCYLKDFSRVKALHVHLLTKGHREYDAYLGEQADKNTASSISEQEARSDEGPRIPPQLNPWGSTEHMTPPRKREPPRSPPPIKRLRKYMSAREMWLRIEGGEC